MTINDRINWVMEDKGLKQKEVAEKTLISRPAMSKICSGANPSTQTVSLFCQAYNVNKEWLTDGIGEPYASYNREKEIASLVKEMYELDDDSFKYRLISALASLNEDQLETFATFIKGLVSSI